jgi:protein ImuA
MSDPRLDQFPNVWRASALARTQSRMQPTGFTALDAALNGGWPPSPLIELLVDQYGIGELQLLIPLIRAYQARTSMDGGRVLLWLHPPFDVHAVALLQWGLEPALHWVSGALTPSEALWAAEQALKSTICAGVIAWIDHTTMTSLRRLKLAVHASNSFAVLFRPLRARASPSPATIRAVLSPSINALQVDLIKVAGALPRTVSLPIHFASMDGDRSRAR